MPKAHATLSASSAYRWLVCTPSAQLEKQFKDEASPYAAEGTRAHAYAERCLNEWLGYDSDNAEADNDEMSNYIAEYVGLCQEKINEARARTKASAVMIEDRVDFSAYVPEGFGTADLVVISEGVLEVVDLKYGKGKPVSAINNPQIRLYALGAYLKYDFIYDIDIVRMTICQPRLNSVTIDELTVKDLLAWADSIKPIAQQAHEGTGECMSGDHCGFCKARHVCRRLAEDMEASMGEFNDPKLLQPTEISHVLDIYSQAKSWLEAVRDYALRQAVDYGKSWPGYKLVEGHSNRVIDPAAIDALRKEGIADAIIFKEPKMRGVTELQKLLGGAKKLDALIGDYITKPKGAPTLATLDDKRPPLENNIVDYFEEV